MNSFYVLMSWLYNIVCRKLAGFGMYLVGIYKTYLLFLEPKDIELYFLCGFIHYSYQLTFLLPFSLYNTSCNTSLCD